jgi:hypothetical protein
LLPASAVDGIVYHYTAAGSDEQADHRNCAGRVRGVQNYHMDTKGWADIAYPLLVCKHGYVFEGRGLTRMGAATLGHNDHTLAVCFLGDDNVNRDDLTPAGRKALLEATRWILASHPRAKKRWGHRDLVQTDCPGDEIFKYIHGDVFARLVDFDNTKRLAALRKWILEQRASGRSWAWIFGSPNGREYYRRGGK